MNPLSLVPSWVWAGLAATLAATSCKLKIDLGSVQLELEKAKVVHEQERAEAAIKLAQEQQRYREADQAIQKTATAIQEETHEQVLAANAAADDLRRRLRVASANAATAALVSSATAPARVAATTVEPGEVVSLRTGDDLVSLALRADEIRADAQACRRQYDAARAEIDALSNHK